jgi:processing peptidase subunit alpha
MNLETRGLLVEDVGRQILSHGKRLDPSALVARIRAVTPEDIIRVMRTALAAPPSFAAVGDVSRIADYEAIREHRESADGDGAEGAIESGGLHAQAQM